MSMPADALAATLARHVSLSNDRRRTLVVLIMGLISVHSAPGFTNRWFAALD